MSGAAAEWDVAVVGGGMAGLAAALRLVGLRVVLIEAEPRFGGRVETLDVGGFTWNRGAQVVIDRSGPTARLADDLGVSLRKINKCGIPLWMSGKLIQARSDFSLFAALPLSLTDKVALAMLMVKVRMRYGAALAKAPDPTDPTQRFLDSEQLDRFVRASSMPSRELWDSLARNSTSLAAAQVAAFQPLSNLLHLTSVEYVVEGGTGNLVKAIVDALLVQHGTRLIRGRPVKSVTDTDGVARINLEDGETLLARHAVLAVPADIAARIVDDLPSWKRTALQAIDYAEDASVAFSLSRPATDFLPHGIWRLPVVGRGMIGLCNAEHASPPDQPRRIAGMIRGYTGHDTAHLLRNMAGEDRHAFLLADLDAILPGAAAACTDVQVALWQRADSPWRVGRLKHIEALARPTGRIFFCGDYVDPSGMNGAVLTGQRAAAQLCAARLGEGAR